LSADCVLPQKHKFAAELPHFPVPKSVGKWDCFR
jgi:hypothetical protein